LVPQRIPYLKTLQSKIISNPEGVGQKLAHAVLVHAAQKIISKVSREGISNPMNAFLPLLHLLKTIHQDAVQGVVLLFVLQLFIGKMVEILQQTAHSKLAHADVSHAVLVWMF